MCGYISETLEHFSLYCIVNWHNDLRIKYAILQQPYIENECELMSHILCFRNCGKRRQKIVKKKNKWIFELWKIRKTKTSLPVKKTVGKVNNRGAVSKAILKVQVKV